MDSMSFSKFFDYTISFVYFALPCNQTSKNLFTNISYVNIMKICIGEEQASTLTLEALTSEFSELNAEYLQLIGLAMNFFTQTSI